MVWNSILKSAPRAGAKSGLRYVFGIAVMSSTNLTVAPNGWLDS
jgi:hypothetical protein